MARDYIEKRDGGHWVAGTRVSLDSIVYAFLRGAAPESIAQSYPVLGLEEVYGAIAFYLANQVEIDAMLASSDREFEVLRRQTREANPALYKKLEEARFLDAVRRGLASLDRGESVSHEEVGKRIERLLPS